MTEVREPKSQRRSPSQDLPPLLKPSNLQYLSRPQRDVMAEYFRQDDARTKAHERLMDYGNFVVRVIGYVCGLTSVWILADVARDYVAAGAATQGATIVISGAVSLVGIFITGRLIRTRPLSTMAKASGRRR